MESPYKGQWRWALTFSSICVWTNGWENSRDASDFKYHRAHYDVIDMKSAWIASMISVPCAGSCVRWICKYDVIFDITDTRTRDKRILVHHYDIIMGTNASQITSLAVVYSTVYSGADQRKHKSSASLALLPPYIKYKVHISGSSRCCSIYIFILDSTLGFNGLGKDNCKTRREIIKCRDKARLILYIWR